MPRTALGQYAKQDERLVKAIKKGMIEKDMQTGTLCGLLGSSKTTHYRHMKEPEGMTLDSLRKYIHALNIPREDVLAALGYTEVRS